MRLFLQKMFCSLSKCGIKIHATTTKTSVNDFVITFKKSGYNFFLLDSNTFILGAFFESFQKKYNSLFSPYKLNQNHFNKTIIFSFLALGVFFIVVTKQSDGGGKANLEIRKIRGHDFFQVGFLQDIKSNNDYNII